MHQNILRDEFNHLLEKIKRVKEVREEYLNLNIIDGCLFPIILFDQASFDLNSPIKANKRNPYIDF